MSTGFVYNNKAHFTESTALTIDPGGELLLPIQGATSQSASTAPTTGISRSGTWVIGFSSGITGGSRYDLPTPTPGAYLDIVVCTTSVQTTGSPQINATTAATIISPTGNYQFAIASSSGNAAGSKILNLVGFSTAAWLCVGVQPSSAWTWSATSS
jgi:hypothetical protein